MRERLILVLFLLGPLYGAFRGALTLFSPAADRRLQLRILNLLRPPTFRLAEDTDRQGLEIQLRVVGALLLTLCICFAWVAFRELVKARG